MTDDERLELAKQDRPISRQELGIKTPEQLNMEVDAYILRTNIIGYVGVPLVFIDFAIGLISALLGLDTLSSIMYLVFVTHILSLAGMLYIASTE